MSELTKEVALAIGKVEEDDGYPSEIWLAHEFSEHAESAIAAATPHIRAALFDELIEQITSAGECLFGEPHADHCPDYDVAEWIAAQKRKENTQP